MNDNALNKKIRFQKNRGVRPSRAQENICPQVPSKTISEVNDILQGIDDPKKIDMQDIDLIINVRNRKQRPLADPLTDLGVDPLIPLKNRKHDWGENTKTNSSSPIMGGQSIITSRIYNDFSDEYDVIPERRSLIEIKRSKSEIVLIRSYGDSNSVINSDSTVRRPPSHRMGILDESGIRKNSSSRFSLDPAPLHPGSSTLINKQFQRNKPSETLNTSVQDSVKYTKLRNRSSIERHYRSVIQNKMANLRNEINRLNEVYNIALVEHNNAFAYEKKVKELASEITEMQQFLAELNTVADNSLFHSSDESKHINEVMELKSSNDSMVKTIEDIFLERLNKTKIVEELEKKLDQETCTKEMISSGIGSKVSKLKGRLKSDTKYSDYLKRKFKTLDSKKGSLQNQELFKLQLPLERAKIKLKGKLTLTNNKSEHKVSDISGETSRLTKIEKHISEILKRIRDSEAILTAQRHKRENSFTDLHFQFSIDSENTENKISTITLQRQEVCLNLQALEENVTQMLNKIQKSFSQITPNHRFITSSLLISHNNLKRETNLDSDTLIYLERYYNYIVIFERKIQNDFKVIDEKIKIILEEIEEFKSCRKLEQNTKEKQQYLLDIKSNILHNKVSTGEGLKITKDRFEKIKMNIDEDEKQSTISQLEEKLSALAELNFRLSEYVEEHIKLNSKRLTDHGMNYVKYINNFLITNIIPNI